MRVGEVDVRQAEMDDRLCDRRLWVVASVVTVPEFALSVGFDGFSEKNCSHGFLFLLNG